jgi:hypothetical protein
MDEARKRLEHMRGDTRVALDVLNESDWHTHVSITGHVEQIREGTDLADIDRLAGSTRASRTRSATAPRSARGSPWTAGTAGRAEGQQSAGLNDYLIRPDQRELDVLRAANGSSRGIADRTKSAIGSWRRSVSVHVV